MKNTKFYIGKQINVSDKMQNNYTYTLSEPIGQNFHPEFKPELTPQQMLKMGVFEGHYLNDCLYEFPSEWFTHAKLSPKHPNPQINFFKIKSRQSLQIWQQKGWILSPDPRGWFQWYCRYYLGRRISDVDKKQIKRWKAFKRHKSQIVKNCIANDLSCRPKQRQALLQWGYNPLI